MARIGFGQSDIPINGYLGRLAFLDNVSVIGPDDTVAIGTDNNIGGSVGFSSFKTENSSMYGGGPVVFNEDGKIGPGGMMAFGSQCFAFASGGGASGLGSTSVHRNSSDFYNVGSSIRGIGLVLHPNGKMYGGGYNINSFYEYDPLTGIAVTFGQAGRPGDNYSTPCSFAIGINGKIYSGMSSGDMIWEIDPATRSSKVFASGFTTHIVGYGISSNLFFNMTAHPDGYIYQFPSNASVIIKIDPIAGTATTVPGVHLPRNINKWTECKVSPYDGKIYCVPAAADSILVYDPVGMTTSKIGTFGSTVKYQGCAFAPNGYDLYAVPYDVTSILKVDTRTGTISTIGNVSQTPNALYGGAILHPNGKIYGIPRRTNKVLEIDPAQDTFVEIPTGLSPTRQNYIGGCIGLDNKIYLPPLQTTRVTTFEPPYVGVVTSPAPWVYSQYNSSF